MRRILLAAIVALGAISSVQPVFAIQIPTNALTVNGLTENAMPWNVWAINGTKYNGQSFPTNPLDGTVDQITSIVLPSGETVR